MKITRSQLRNLTTVINGIPLADLVAEYKKADVLRGLEQVEALSAKLVEANQPFEKAIQELQKTIHGKKGLDGQPVSQETLQMLEQQSDANKMKDESFEFEINEDEETLLRYYLETYGVKAIQHRGTYIELLKLFV